MSFDLIASIISSLCFLIGAGLVLRMQHYANKRLELVCVQINLLERILFEGIGIPDHRNAAVRSLIARAKAEASEL